MRPIIPYEEEGLTSSKKCYRNKYPILFLEINGIVVRKIAIHFAELKMKELYLKKLVQSLIENEVNKVESYEIYYTILSKMDTKAVREKYI